MGIYARLSEGVDQARKQLGAVLPLPDVKPHASCKLEFPRRVAALSVFVDIGPGEPSLLELTAGEQRRLVLEMLRSRITTGTEGNNRLQARRVAELDGRHIGIPMVPVAAKSPRVLLRPE